MYSLAQSVNIRGHVGEPLPVVWPSLDAKLARGQLVLVSAAPGTGKSALALNLALRFGGSGVYFSADSDSFVQLVRSISVLTDSTVDKATRLVETGEIPLEVTESKLRMVYDSAPGFDSIESTLESYIELTNTYPEMIIVDNLTNVSGIDAEDASSGLEHILDYLHSMARETQACVIVLHHVTGWFNQGSVPIPLSGVKGQVARVPHMVWTLHTPLPGQMAVSVVKNRAGKADPSGSSFTPLRFPGDNMRITDYAE